MSERRSGAVLSYVSLATSALTSFAYVPIMLRCLTQSEYGVYELIGSIVAYLTLMDLGLTKTLSRFYVRSREQDDGRDTENLLSLAAIVYAIITLLAVLVGIVIDRCLDLLFSASLSAEELSLAHQMMVLVIIDFVIMLPGNWFYAVITARERFVFTQVIHIVKNILQCGAIIAVLLLRSDALLVLGVQVLMNLVNVGGYVWYFRRLDVSVRFHHWDGRLLASMLGFSFFVFLNVVFNQVFWKTGQFILGAVAGTAAVAVYGVAYKLISSGFTQVSQGVSSVFLPRLTQLAATGATGEMNAVFVRIGRIQAMLVWGVLVAFAVLGQEFIYLWAGEGYEAAYYITLVLMVGLCFEQTQDIGVSILQAINRQGFRAVVYTVMAVVDVAACFACAGTFGAVGCAVATAAIMLVGTGPVMNWYYATVIGLDIRGFFRQVVPLALPMALAAVGTLALDAVVGAGGYGIGHFALRGMAFVVLYAVALWRLGFNAYERGLVETALGRVRGLFGRR